MIQSRVLKWFWLGHAVPYVFIRAQASSPCMRYVEILGRGELMTVAFVDTPLIHLGTSVHLVFPLDCSAVGAAELSPEPCEAITACR